ncbi:MAG: hypothetical protein CM1200mP2_49810 [Planctomycetaceae bacterium]|nr:MAG: hypothetical protein CM1200mP2_49810 [Planctomycetaceae bacterium]
MELDHPLALATIMHGDVLHDRPPVDQLTDVGPRPSARGMTFSRQEGERSGNLSAVASRKIVVRMLKIDVPPRRVSVTIC